MQYGGLGLAGWVPGIAHPASHPSPLPRVHPPTRWSPYYTPGMPHTVVNMAVGLISVAQLTLDAEISGFLGITEVYNLVRIDRINDHFLIPGFK